MKRIFLFTFAVLISISFCACMGTLTSQSSQMTQIIKTEEPIQSENPQITSSSISYKNSVEIVNGNVVETTYTDGIKQVFTYYFQNGGIVGVDVLITCTNVTEAQTMYDVLQKTNVSSKAYENLKIEGNVVTASYSSDALAVYSGKTEEQLKAYLEQL